MENVYGKGFRFYTLYIDLNVNVSSISTSDNNKLGGLSCQFNYTLNGASTSSTETTYIYSGDTISSIVESCTNNYIAVGVNCYSNQTLSVNSVNITNVYNAFKSNAFSFTTQQFSGFSMCYPNNSAALQITQSSCVVDGSAFTYLYSVADGPVTGVILKARWGDAVAVEYKNTDGSTISGSNLSSNAPTEYWDGIPMSLTSVTASKAGHTFDGWYDNAACSGSPITEINGTHTSTITLYAKFTRQSKIVSITLTMSGTNNSAIILYLLKGGTMQQQIVRTSSGTFTLQQAYGDAYTLLVNKPYMWSITATGSGTLNGCMYTYTVADTNTIAITISGSSSTNQMIVI